MRKIYATAVFLLLITTSVIAQKLPFQGYLEESGIPVNGNRTFDFELVDYGWSETITDVSIDNGIYNVVLGEITPLPDTIFSNLSETGLSIAVDGTNIGSVILYKPLINGASLAQNGESLQVKNSTGNLRGELFPTEGTGVMRLYGANDSVKVSASGAYAGRIFVHDSLGAVGAQLRTSNKGLGSLFTYNENQTNVGWFGGIGNDGFTQLVSYDETEAISGAILLGSFVDGIHPEVYIEGVAQPNFGLGRFRVIELSGGEETALLEINRSNGGGNARLSISQDDAGADPSGVSATLDLFADSSPNFLFGSASWEDHDLANMSAYGSIPDGGSWFFSALDLGASKTGDGTQEFGFLNLHNNRSGGSINTLSISGNLYESGAGGIELRDTLGTTTAILEARGNGNSGQLKIRGNNGLDIAAVQNRGGNSGQAVFFGPSGGLRTEVGSFGDDSGFLITYGPNGNKNVQLDRNPGNTDLGQFSLFGEDGINPRVFTSVVSNGVSEWGTLTLDGPQSSINLDANTGIGFFANAAIGQQTNGIVHLYGEQGGTPDNLRLQLEVRPDGSGSSFGFIEVRDSAFNSTIQIDGNSGGINAFGTISGTSVVQTSDKRYKKDISNLDNSLTNTLKLRGVSYYWKEENKSKKRQIGVIAQEIEEIYPEFVHTDDQGMKAVNYAQMTAVLIEAVKELNAKIIKLETENAELTTALKETKQLSDRIGKLEKLLLEGTEVSSN